VVPPPDICAACPSPSPVDIARAFVRSGELERYRAEAGDRKAGRLPGLHTPEDKHRGDRWKVIADEVFRGGVGKERAQHLTELALGEIQMPPIFDDDVVADRAERDRLATIITDLTNQVRHAGKGASTMWRRAFQEREAFLTPEGKAHLQAERERKVAESATTPDDDYLRRVAELPRFMSWSPDVSRKQLDRFAALVVPAVDSLLARFMDCCPTEDQLDQMDMVWWARRRSPGSGGTTAGSRLEFPWPGELPAPREAA
jgi:hypothetical protein